MPARAGAPSARGEGTPRPAAQVPVILADFSGDGTEHKLRSGKLADLAPTILELLALPQVPRLTRPPRVRRRSWRSWRWCAAPELAGAPL